MPKKIYISPSDQGKNTYAAGDTNEEVQCERIAIELEKALIRCGFEVVNNMTGSMAARVAESNEWGADLHLPIHTNGFNAKVTGTRLMSYDLVGEGYKACVAIFKYLAPLTPGISENISAHPELYEVQNSLAPCAYVEVDFHDVPDVALWIIENTVLIAEAICKGVCEHFGVEYVVPEQGDEVYVDDAAQWSKKAREWAIENGLINGIGNGKDGNPNYAWEASVSREQLVTILHRFAKVIGKA